MSVAKEKSFYNFDKTCSQYNKTFFVISDVGAKQATVFATGKPFKRSLLGHANVLTLKYFKQAGKDCISETR
jgi:hypothetical protein